MKPAFGRQILGILFAIGAINIIATYGDLLGGILVLTVGVLLFSWGLVPREPR
jgi:hypothetical protein